MTISRVTFPAHGGEPTSGALAEPKGETKAPALVLLQEYWGVNKHIESLVERFANEGFLTLAPDLFHGYIATNAEDASKKLQSLDWPRALREIHGAVEHLRSHPRGNGKVAVTGFCMGGALAFATAAQVPGLAAVVPFYGIPPQFDATKVTAPILAHFAKHDDWCTPALAEGIKKQLDAAGKSVDLYQYDSRHAFMNDTRPEVHDPASARTAWERTIAFLRKHTA